MQKQNSVRMAKSTEQGIITILSVFSMRNWQKHNSPEARAARRARASYAAQCRWEKEHRDGPTEETEYERARRAPVYRRVTIEGCGPTVVINLSRSERNRRQYDCSGGLTGTHSATTVGCLIGWLLKL